MTAPQARLGAGKGIWIARHESAAGYAIVNRLWREKCSLVLASGSQFDPERPGSLERWMTEHRPDAVIVADGRVSRGGDPARRREAESIFLRDLTAAARTLGVEQVVQVVPATPQPTFGAHRTIVPSCGRPSRSHRPAPPPFARGAGRLIDREGRRTCSFVTLAAPMVYSAGWSAEWGPPPFLTDLVDQLGLAVLRGASSFTIVSDCPVLPPMIHADDLADAVAFAADNCAGPALLRCGPTNWTKLEDLARVVVETVGFRGSVEIRCPTRIWGDVGDLPGRRLESLGWKARLPLREGVADLYNAWFRRKAAARSGAFLRQ